MGEEKKQQSGGLPTTLPLMAVLAILAGWFFTSPSPYEEERPSSRPLQASLQAEQDVEARLWQDPFAAVESSIEKTENNHLNVEGKKPSFDWNSHGWNRIYSKRKNQAITIIAVTIPGDSYQEAAEQRMRRRYAVLSALANQNAFPQDPQHIGYVQPEPKLNLQKSVPFEWWSLPNNRDVLLLWIDESNLVRGMPATKLKKLLSKASPNNTPNQIEYKVIGPNSSSILRELLKEVQLEKNSAIVFSCHNKPEGNVVTDTLGRINGHSIEYYAAGATASDEQLLKGIDEEKADVSAFLCDHGVRLYRTTARDDDMMDVLAHELELRKVEKSGHVILLSEWDTFYGRAMPEAFKTVWSQHGGDKTKVNAYSYMRGLDGKLPDKADRADVASEKKSSIKDKSSAEVSIELPAGQNQKDYLRRLTSHILELDQDLKGNGVMKGIAAIGVLGSDVHDKLMILEALRQHFPHKLFFITDLDAAYRHPAKWPQTHNLLVASAFNLKLRPELQGQIPPFRDTYQTALFLATQMALQEGLTIDNKIVMPLPRLFEIGRNRTIPLPTKKDKVLPEGADDNCGTNLPLCYKHVQPALFATYQFYWTGKIAITVLLLILTPLFVSWSIRILWKEYLGCVAAVLFLSVLLLKLWWNNYIIKVDAEPFYWLEGVSAWPSQLLRLSALLFAGGFYWWWRKRIKKIQSELQVKPSSHKHETIFALPLGSNEVGSWDALFVGNWKEKNNDEVAISPDRLWEKYLGYCQPKNVFYRVLAHSIFFFAVSALIISMELPNMPTRGSLAYTVNSSILLMTVCATIMLTMWVVENARLCERLIYNLSLKPSRWNDVASAWAVGENKVASECVQDWLDIQLVLRLTESLQQLIWGPMVCIVLLVLARSPAIDDWGIPWGMGVVLTVMLIYAISSEVFLQRGAASARTKAIEQLTRKIIAQGNETKPDDAMVKRIESEIERIKLLRRGAFSPWYEWPLLQSIGGLSTMVFVLQYLAGVWEKGSF